jgi:hypothetical protein
MMRMMIAAMLMTGVFALTPASAQDAGVEVRATCVDARGVPHPAAQTFGERETPVEFEGELFRCLPGTQLRYDVDHAVNDCAAGEALWFGAGALSCRAAAEHPREHDRELLRRFRAGVKVVRLAQEAPPAQAQPQTQTRYPYRRRN